MSNGSGGRAEPSASTPVKWTLVEAVAETPEGSSRRKHNQRKTHSGSTGKWQGGGGGRGRGGGLSSGNRGQRRGGWGGASRNNHAQQGRGRGYGEGYGGVTYYPVQSNVDFEEQKAYMINMAVRQIEFYFTVENLCRDIFMRSYMDEEGFLPIAFVANFPGVARFGVELEDITAGILASDFLQVDTENETMRMREGWEVWLLPNQATGRQGVPRYIKVDPASISEASRLDATESRGNPEQTTQNFEASAVDAEEEQVPVKDSSGGAAKKKDGGVPGPAAERAAQKEGRSLSSGGPAQHEEEVKTELTPLAPAWTPGEAAAGVVQEQVSTPQRSPTATLSPDDKTIPEGETGGKEAAKVTGEAGIPTAESNPPRTATTG